MRFVFLTVLSLVFFINPVTSQDDFEQRVDHSISAVLDTSLRTLAVRSTVIYHNNSQDTLDKLVFHVWKNAFADRNSEYARSELAISEYENHFAKAEERSHYKELKFSENDRNLNFEFYKQEGRTHKDVVIIDLKNKILPRSTRRINIVYTLQLKTYNGKESFRNSNYWISNWYPQPAKYTIDGWQIHPYGSPGSYLSNFGNYEVELTVPISFSVAGTGRQMENRSSLDIANRQRTIFFEAQNVHMHVWYGSEDLIPYQESVNLNGESITVNLLLKENNENYEDLFFYTKRAMRYMSSRLGPYAYNEISLVEDDELDEHYKYPMLSVLSFEGEDQCIDRTIAHQIAHQWFYACMTSELENAQWINEGFSNYLDDAYENTYYESDCTLILWDIKKPKADRHDKLHLKEIVEVERSGYNASIVDVSMDKAPLTGSSILTKIPAVLNFLESYIGTEYFDLALTRLFRLWRFKEARATDLQQVFESVCGKDLDWLFKDYINSDMPFDLSISKVDKNKITIKREGNLNMPFKLFAYNASDKLIISSWFESNGEEEQTVELFDANYNSFAINKDMEMGDVNWKNNVYPRRPGLLPKFAFGSFIDSDYIKTVGYVPHFMNNQYDGFMLGASVYSPFFPRRSFRYIISPSYSFKSESLRGIATFQKDFLFHRKKNLRKLMLSLDTRRFSYFEEVDNDRFLEYWKLTPSISLHFSKDIFNFSSLDYQYHRTVQDAYFFDQENLLGERTFQMHQLNYHLRRQLPLGKYRLHAQLQYENYKTPLIEEKEEYLRLSLTMDWMIKYASDYGVHVRSFAGYFPVNSRRESSSFSSVFTRGSFALASQGYTDQNYEDFYFNRNGTVEGEASQIHMRDAGFKTAFGFSNPIGLSNDYIAAINLKMDLPFKIFEDIRVRPYMDMAVSSTKAVTADELSNEFYYSGGLSIEAGEHLGLYIPLINSDNLKPGYDSGSIFKRISFMFDIEVFDSWRLADEPVRLKEVW